MKASSQMLRLSRTSSIAGRCRCKPYAVVENRGNQPGTPGALKPVLLLGVQRVQTEAQCYLIVVKSAFGRKLTGENLQLDLTPTCPAHVPNEQWRRPRRRWTMMKSLSQTPFCSLCWKSWMRFMRYRRILPTTVPNLSRDDGIRLGEPIGYSAGSFLLCSSLSS